MPTNDEIIEKIGIEKKKITGKAILKIIQEGGADSLADDLTNMRDTFKNFLNPALNEARADERANTELLKKVLLELIDAIAHYLSDDPDYNISTLTKAIINGQKALKKKYGVD